MINMSHWTPARHADESQSGRPCSTSSTNWYLSAGRLRRKASFSSEELTVIVQTVVLSACAGAAAKQSATRGRTRAVRECMVAYGIPMEFAPLHRGDFTASVGQWRNPTWGKSVATIRRGPTCRTIRHHEAASGRKEMTMQIGMIGLGRMGANMVRRLAAAGHDCVVFNRSAKAVKELAAEGVAGAVRAWRSRAEA